MGSSPLLTRGFLLGFPTQTPPKAIVAISKLKQSTTMSSLAIKIRLSSSRQQNLAIFTAHFSTQTQQKEDFPLIAQYLISSFDFSEERALRVAADKNLSQIKTLDRPESVICFLKDAGLSDNQIKDAISLSPQLLYSSVSKTLQPCIREIIAGGFTGKTLLQLIRYNPYALNYKKLLSRLQFWRDFLCNDEEALLKLLKNRIMINLDIDKRIIPQIELLREYGWSEGEIQDIAKKYPNVLGLPEEKAKSKMNFLIKKVGFSPKCIVEHPYLLGYSLEKRLVPRYHVLSLLKNKGLIESYNPYALSALSHKGFVVKFIEPYQDKVPELENILSNCI